MKATDKRFCKHSSVFYIVQHKVSKVFPLEKEKEKVLREPPSPFLPPDSRTVFPGRPWWLSGKESAYQCRSHRVDPWGLRRSHPLQGNQAGAPQLLSLRSWAWERQLRKPTCLEPVLCGKRGRHNEKPVHCREEWPPRTATRDSPRSS